MKYKAYAKVNLMLKVVGVLPSGYHELQMVNARINLFDEIIIKHEANQDIKVEIINLEVSENENIVLHAVCELALKYPKLYGVCVTINKMIPAGSGLGGASADLACVVKALNEEYQLGLSFKEMESFVKKYSADAVYCLYHQLALVEGIGEKVMLLPGKIDDYIMVVTPDKRNKTKEIFKKVYKYTSKIKKCDIIKEDILAIMENDLEEPAISTNEDIKIILDELKQFTKKAVMTGSGSSVIALFDYTMLGSVCRYINEHSKYLIYLSTVLRS